MKSKRADFFKAFVGAIDTLGMFVGCWDGEEEGIIDGMLVGEALGTITVGKADGLNVGDDETLGESVGSIDGAVEGLPEGDELGALVGCADGNSEGCDVGYTVGGALGASVG